MPVPSSITDLSTTAASNSPSGSESPTDGDNYVRALSAFIATLRDKLNGTSDTGTVKNPTVSGTVTGLQTADGQTLCRVAYKTATTTKTGDTTMADDPHLAVAIPGKACAFEALLRFTATTSGAGGIKFQLDTDATYTSSGFDVLGSVNGVAERNSFALTNTIAYSAISTTTDYLFVRGFIVATVAGTLRVRWAQNSATNSANLLIGSHIKLTQLQA